ncbi:TlyA family RNA methyltransferase [Candidatus Margulisiibacteriota bacterium]
MKIRLDILLVEKGLCPSRQKAQGMIMAGLILVNDQKIEKAGHPVDTNSKIRILGDNNPYVGRGGLKLAKALTEFNIDVHDRTCLDIGASTGGFTDCLLQNGARKVYAVDVGHDQLDWKIRSDPRVIVFEKTNARYLTPDVLYKPDTAPATLAVIDVSFISLSKILPAVKDLLAPGPGDVIALVKPQFEAGREQVEKGGLVKDPKVHQQVLNNVKAAAAELGFVTAGETESPIFGADGNKEFLLWLTLHG